MDVSKLIIGNKLAANIRHLRKQLSISQEDLAKQLNLNRDKVAAYEKGTAEPKILNRGNIASYEKGTAEPKICNLLNLANFYKVSVIDLTTSDLRCPIALGSARNNYRYELKAEDKVVLEKFREQAAELKKVMESVQVCHEFKLKSMDNVPSGLQCVVASYNQLHDVSAMLIKAQDELLEFVKTRMK